jgi:hypothetical protein
MTAQATMEASFKNSASFAMSLLQPSQPLAVRDAAYLIEPPPGEVRTFGSDRPTLAPGLIAFGCASTVVAAMAVFLRLYTRTYAVRNAVSGDDCEFISLGGSRTLTFRPRRGVPLLLHHPSGVPHEE